MKRAMSHPRAVVVAGLLLAAAIPSAIFGSASATSDSPASVASTQIAVSTLGPDMRVTLTAVQGPTEGVPTATVRVAAYRRSGGEWRFAGRQRVGDRDGWWWNVVTGSHAICRFSVSDVAPYPIEVRPLVTPSIGCSEATYNFHIDRWGKLVLG